MDGRMPDPPPIALEHWDILIAKELSTTPWDVRENMTYYDQARLLTLIESRNKNEKVARAQAEAKGRVSQSRPTRVRPGRRPRRRGRRR